MRLCSRKRPMIDLTRIFSDRPAKPGRRQQMPRTTRSMLTPAREASYNRSMISGSTSALSFIQMPALPPHYQRELGMGLELDKAKHDLRAGAFQIARPANIGLLVEARLQFYECGD